MEGTFGRSAGAGGGKREGGAFEYFPDEDNMEAKLIREGRYIVTTNHPHISPEEAVAHYKELSDIEARLREFKDVIRGRPIYHQRDDRICAHLFIAQLALLLPRELRYHYHLSEKEVLLRIPSPRKDNQSGGVQVAAADFLPHGFLCPGKGAS